MEPIPSLPEGDFADGYVGFRTRTMVETSFWSIRRLWQLAADLPVRQQALSDFSHVLDDKAEWFADGGPTIRELAYHAQRIVTADLRYPIILSAEGFLLEGKHRLAKAWILQHDTIATVQFTDNPPPDFREPA